MPPAWRRDADLVAATAAVAAAVVAPELAPASALRVLLAVLGLLAPGYLLMAVVEPEAVRGRRAFHAALALGLGPAVVGLAAYSLTFFPGAFTGEAMAGLNAGVALVLGVAAWARRSKLRRATQEAPPPDMGDGPGRMAHGPAQEEQGV